MSAYLANVASCLLALLPVLLVIAGLTLVAFILDARSHGKW